MLGWCWACFFLGIQKQREGNVLVNPEKSGLRNSSEAKRHLSMALGGCRFAGDFFSGGKGVVEYVSFFTPSIWKAVFSTSPDMLGKTY